MTTDTRQQLYDRIRESSMDEVILEEMIRFGFWPQEQGKPSLPAELIKRRGELQREIAELAKQASAYENRDRAVQEIMKERMLAARERRVETKKRNAQQRYDKAVAWHEKKRDDVVHLGDAVSPALNKRDGNTARLVENGLPQFADMKAIAEAMGVPVGELRFLSYNRNVSKVSHYKRFQIAKKTGGMRTVSAPMPRLKRAQYWLLDAILKKVEPHDAAHGFRTDRSIMTNAAPHTGKAVVINLDLKDFFPSISYRRVKGLFAALGYPEAQAAIFALLATEAEQTQLKIDGDVWNVASGKRTVPQGAPTSPAITNLLCRKLDRRLAGAAKKYGFAYTRYADDMTFSATVDDKDAVSRLMKVIRFVVGEEGFTINEDKTRVMRQGQHQEVTGLTVNDGLSVSRRERRRFRAYLHKNRAVANPPSWRSGSARASALGYAQFLSMVHGDSVSGLVGLARNIFGDGKPEASRPKGTLGGRALREAAARGEAPRAEWWTPREVAAPELPIELQEPEVVDQATSVPTAGGQRVVRQQRAQGRGAARDTMQGQQRGESSFASALRTLRRRRILLTALSVLFLPLQPIGIFLFAASIYFLWFHRID